MFETVIRVLGGMLSAHTLLVRDPTLVPGYDGIFLTRSVDLARRLLPAFKTPTGIPMMYLNLQSVGPLSRLWCVTTHTWKGCDNPGCCGVGYARWVMNWSTQEV